MINWFSSLIAGSTALSKFLTLLEAVDDRRPNLLRVLTYHHVDEPGAYPRLYPCLISTTRHCDRTGLPREMVEPLFYTCWMHRALKEATRLTSSRLERGHYVSLLRLCIDQREAPTLRRLFSLSGLEASRPSSP